MPDLSDVEDFISDLLAESGPYFAAIIADKVRARWPERTAAYVTETLLAMHARCEAFEWGGWWTIRPKTLRSPRLAQFYTVPPVHVTQAK